MATLKFIAIVLVLSSLAGQGNTIGLHRLLTHRSFKCGPVLRWWFTLWGATFSGSPVMWVGIHRLHHMKSDADGDPHSPIHGWWWSHTGWMIGTANPVLSALYAVSGFGEQAVILVHDLRRLAGTNPPEWRGLCHDLMKEPGMRFLDTPMVMPALFAMQLAVAWLWAGLWGIFGLWLCHLFLTNTSWGVNSICHTEAFGVQNFDTKEGSRDVWWMALITNGEGYHNGHHRYPRSAKHGLKGGADLSWWVIHALERLGLVWDVWLPKAYR